MTRAIAIFALLAACASDPPADDGDCAPVMRGDQFSGRNGWTLTIVMTNPTPPARFTNWWAVAIDDPDGAPMIDAASLEVTAFMPEHGHGAPVVPGVTSEPDGLVVGPLELWMPGRWEVRFDVEGERIIVPVCLAE